MTDEIEYEVVIKVTVPTIDAGRPEDDPPPYDMAFYAYCPGKVELVRATRITPGVNYGGPR